VLAEALVDLDEPDTAINEFGDAEVVGRKPTSFISNPMAEVSMTISLGEPTQESLKEAGMLNTLGVGGREWSCALRCWLRPLCVAPVARPSNRPCGRCCSCCPAAPRC
jgi:hypothetical protein